MNTKKAIIANHGQIQALCQDIVNEITTVSALPVRSTCTHPGQSCP
jgi:hypothetical protein